MKLPSYRDHEAYVRGLGKGIFLFQFARGLAAAAAVRPGDVVVALDDDVGPHRDLLAFASRCEAAANRARDRNTHVALTLASDIIACGARVLTSCLEHRSHWY